MKPCSQCSIVFAFVLIGVFVGHGEVLAQTRIDGSMPFEGDPTKRYSIVVPLGYEPSVASKAVLALHPFHPAWGSATSWCDILTQFAQQNNVIVYCPDGGIDGRIDDQIDRNFSIALSDSMMNWYNVDADSVFGLGFSFGARSLYMVGLDNPDRFAGFITIGAFLNGLAPVGNSRVDRSAGKPFYIMHGDSDRIVDLITGFFPIKNALEAAGAVVNSLILEGVGHTINFADRDAILSEALNWLSSRGIQTSISTHEGRTLPLARGEKKPFPNPFHSFVTIPVTIQTPSSIRMDFYTLLGYHVSGTSYPSLAEGVHELRWDGMNETGESVPAGLYLYRISIGGIEGSQHFISGSVVRVN